MNENVFKDELLKLGITISKEQLNKLEIYCEELLEYNKHTNLTAIKDKESVYLKHFYDSLTFIKAVELNNQKIIDVGTGAGFPGLVLKIMFPSINLTLLDSNNKKTKFLSYICEKLEIEATIVNDRIENFVKDNRYKFDIVTARAVSHLRIISELCLPLLKDDGLFIPLKGELSNELVESMETLEVLNSKILNKIEFLLPIEKSKRTILIIKQMDNISNEYPRSYDKIVKKPLKKASK